MAEIDVKTGDKEGEATLFECPMFQNYQGRAEFTLVYFISKLSLPLHSLYFRK